MNTSYHSNFRWVIYEVLSASYSAKVHLLTIRVDSKRCGILGARYVALLMDDKWITRGKKYSL